MTTPSANLGAGSPVPRWARTAITAGLIPAVAGCASVASHAPPDSGIALPLDAPAPSAPDRGHAAVMRHALKYVGVPYRWGGSTPAGFDCSGFVQYVYTRGGIALPRSVAAQYRVGAPVDRASLRPGDLVFFDRLRHNGIYIGDGKFVHASSGDGRVSISRLDGDWFRHRWAGGRRIPPPAPATAAIRPPTLSALPEAAASGD